MKKLLSLSILLTLLISFSFTPNKEKFVIVLDASHGGKDTGSQHGSLVEKDYSLEIAKKIIALNANENVEFVLSRDIDEFIELGKRVERINELQPDLVISLHLNKAINEELNGYEIFISPENNEFESSKLYAEKLISQLKSLPLSNRGVKEQRFKIIRESNHPAILFEMGFVSNETDRNYLISDKGQNEIAQNIINFVNSL